MKKWFSLLILGLMFPLLSGCEVSNTELANSLEGNMTRLVYSIGYLDSVSTEELSNLVNNSSYFTHSSLYGGGTNDVIANSNVDEPLISSNDLTSTNGSSNNFFSGRENYRHRTYNTHLENGNSYNNTATQEVDEVTNTTTASSTYTAGVVDMSLLETNAEYLNQILLDISTKRGIIMLYCTDLRSGRATLSAEAKLALSEYDDIIQETTNYLNNTTGSLTNHFNGISSISANENSAELINAKLIRANEVLKTRYAKLDTCLDSLDAIINILVNSIGYNYAELYNNASMQYFNNNVALNNETSSLNNVGLENSETEIVEKVEENSTLNSTLDNSTPQNNNLSNNVCNDCVNSSEAPLNSVNQNSNATSTSPQPNYGIQTLPLTEKDYGDTIVNYNYDGNNSSSINNYPSNPNVNTNVNTTTNPSSQIVENNTISEEVQSNQTATTYPLRNQTVVANDVSKTEIALNGGLVKHQNSEKITAGNVDSFVARCSASPDEIRPIDMAKPYIKNDTKDIKEPPLNLFDEEIVESEKELTPELLPFTGSETESSTLEFRPDRDRGTVRPLQSAPELGLISLPFQYQEDNVLKKIPRN